MNPSRILSATLVGLCGLAIIFGVFLCFYYGLSTDLWDDEAISFFAAKNLSWWEIVTSSSDYWTKDHPTLHLLLLKVLLLVSYDDSFLRLSSLFWFFPSLYLVFNIGRRFLSSQQTLMVMALFATHPLLVNLSFQVRPYSLAIFLSLASIYWLFEYWQNPKPSSAVALGLFLGLGILTSYALIWLLIVVFLALVWRGQKLKWRGLFQDYLYLLLVFLLLTGYQWWVLFDAMLGKFLHGQQIAGSVYVFGWQWFVKELDLIVGIGVPEISFTLLILISVVFFKINQKNRIGLFWLGLLVLSIVLSAVVSVVFSPIFLSRQLFLASIALVFIVAKLTVNVRSQLFYFFILATYLYLSWQAHGFLFQGGIDSKIKQQVRGGDVLVTADKFHSYLKYYLFINDTEADVFVFDLFNKNKNNLLFSEIENGKNIVVFDNFCPDEYYDLCRQAWADLQAKLEN